MPVNQSKYRKSTSSSESGPPENDRLYLREDNIDQGAYLVITASRRLRRLALQAAAAPELMDAKLDILMDIHFHEGSDVASLRERLGAAKQSTTRNLNELEENGFVQRDVAQDDRRRRILKLTERGRELTTAAAKGWREVMREAYRRQGPGHVSSTRDLLATLLDEIEKQVTTGK